MSGDMWEELCVRCYRLRYQANHYTPIPATNGGDAGIEGYTKNGIVHQCYCPEREYTDDDLYEHQRDKLTTDIDKLKKNASRLKELGVPPVIEWHFNIPEYKDSRIIKHAIKKQNEILEAKNNNPSEYKHIANNFQIIIKTAEDFLPEISRIFRTNLSDEKLNLAIKPLSNLDWTKCDSEKVSNIRRKMKAILHSDDTNDSLNKLVEIYVGYYINGLENMNDLRVNFPEIYDELYRLEQSYKNEVAIKTLMSIDKTMNHELFNTILNEFDVKLRQDFSPKFDEAAIMELKNDLIASWLADCSIEFGE